MGLFGDFFREVASEIGNAIVEGINESVEAEKIKNETIAEYKESFTTLSLETLDEYKKTCDELQLIAINEIIEERKNFVDNLKNHRDEFCGTIKSLDDSTLIEYYTSTCHKAGGLFGEENRELVIGVYQEALFARPYAKNLYKEEIKEELESSDYSDLIKIKESTDIIDDEVKKAVAQEELDYRNQIIHEVLENIDDLDNSEFMEIYHLVRRDQTKRYFDFSMDESTEEETENLFYNSYFSEFRQSMLEKCGIELFENRTYLIDNFISEYCEEEIEKFNNMSTKKLASILQQLKDEPYKKTVDFCNITEYDICSATIICAILNERTNNLRGE